MIDLFNYQRRKTSETHVGSIAISGENPVRIQSMTTTNTNDTEACVAQAERIVKAGGELVRLTTQGIREAENLKNISAGIRNDGFSTPLVADVHFNPNVADVAALYAEKVRINPGNYVDPARRFIKHDYTDEEYAQELQKLRNDLCPFSTFVKNITGLFALALTTDRCPIASATATVTPLKALSKAAWSFSESAKSKTFQTLLSPSNRAIR